MENLERENTSSTLWFEHQTKSIKKLGGDRIIEGCLLLFRRLFFGGSLMGGLIWKMNWRMSQELHGSGESMQYGIWVWNYSSSRILNGLVWSAAYFSGSNDLMRKSKAVEGSCVHRIHHEELENILFFLRNAVSSPIPVKSNRPCFTLKLSLSHHLKIHGKQNWSIYSLTLSYYQQQSRKGSIFLLILKVSGANSKYTKAARGI